MPTPEQDLTARLAAVRAPHLQVDLDAVVRDGERRTLRRRVTLFALAACFVVLAGIGFGALRPGGFLAEPLPPAVPTHTETEPEGPVEPAPTDDEGGGTDDGAPPGPTDGPTTTGPTDEEGEAPPDAGPPEIGWVAAESDSLELPDIEVRDPGDGSPVPPDVITIAREAGDTSTTVTFEGGTGSGEPIPLEEPMTGPEVFREGESVLVLWPMAPDSTASYPVTVGEDGRSSSTYFGGWDNPSVELAGQTLGYRYVPRAPAEWDVTDVLVEGPEAWPRGYASVSADTLTVGRVSDGSMSAAVLSGSESGMLAACSTEGTCATSGTGRVAWTEDVEGAHLLAARLPAGVEDVRGVAEGGGLSITPTTGTTSGAEDTLVIVIFPLDGDYSAIRASDDYLITLQWVDEDGQTQVLEPWELEGEELE